LRYVLAAIAPETKDSDFSWKDFQTRNNSELVAILGNFVNRVAVLTQKFYGDKVPFPGKSSSKESDLISEFERCTEVIQNSIENFKFREALFELMNIARAGNKYLADNEPWKMVKTDKERTDTVMFHALQLVSHLAWWMEPFMPFTAGKLFNQIKMEKKGYKKGAFVQMESDHTVNPPSLLFQNIENDIIELQLQHLKTNREKMTQSETGKISETKFETLKPEISYDDFSNMDLRVATVLEAEKVEKADKLLKLKVDLGFEIRTIVSGIALDFTPESLIGKQITVLANLAPRKIKGIESNGMLLMAKNSDGSLKLVAPGENAENGSTIA
jgi:methionyl-tRNA synthetase